MDDDCWATITELMNRYDPDPPHARQVCSLSLKLFDCMTELHLLSGDERDLLKAGALLHDIGWSDPEKPHHKASRDMILADRSIPLKRKERILIAMIARYHRKSPPKQQHKGYCDLDPHDQNIVRFCSAILRIADALDRSHRSLVSDLFCGISKGEMVITCTCTDNPVQEIGIFAEKSQYLETISNHHITLVCN